MENSGELKVGEKQSLERNTGNMMTQGLPAWTLSLSRAISNMALTQSGKSAAKFSPQSKYPLQVNVLCISNLDTTQFFQPLMALKEQHGKHFASPACLSHLLFLDAFDIRRKRSRSYSLARQARSPMDFMGALRDCNFESLVDDRSLRLECGPGKSCLGIWCGPRLALPGDRIFPSPKRDP